MKRNRGTDKGHRTAALKNLNRKAKRECGSQVRAEKLELHFLGPQVFAWGGRDSSLWKENELPGERKACGQ